LLGCGITQPKYVDYSGGTGTATAAATRTDTTTATGTGTDDACAQEALALFTEQVGGSVDATCATASCHALTAIQGQALKAGDHETNRRRLLAYTGGVASKLFDKISLNGQTHGGGDRSDALPLANIEAWLDKEAECNATP
jgi:hypothetical protein